MYKPFKDAGWPEQGEGGGKEEVGVGELQNLEEEHSLYFLAEHSEKYTQKNDTNSLVYTCLYTHTHSTKRQIIQQLL